MAEIPNLREKLKELEEESKKLHDAVFEAFKETVDPFPKIKYSAMLHSNYIYSIHCGNYMTEYYTHMIFYFDGTIQLFEMNFGQIKHHIKKWTTIEDFKKEIVHQLKN